MATTLKGRILKAGGWGLAKRLIKPVPIVGSIVAVGLAGYEIKKKGVVRGVIDVGLDITPIIGTVKNVVEIFTGDLIPDKPQSVAGGGNSSGDGGSNIIKRLEQP
jgi:hypothetical protein